MAAKKRIGVVIQLPSGYMHDLVAGVAAEARLREDWTLRYAGLCDNWIPQLLDWRPHGLIACVQEGPLRRLLETGAAAVNVSGARDNVALPTVRVSDAGIGRLAAEHFLDLHISHFAYWGGHDAHFTTLRGRGFFHALEARGVRPQQCHAAPDCSGQAWRRRDAILQRWLRALPKPVGLLVSQDAQAYYVADLARQAGLDIPNAIALLGVDDDRLTCELIDPPLSSIRLPARQVGRQAVQLLERLLAGEPPPREPILLEPLTVAARGSTDMLAIADGRMAEAVRLMRAGATEGLRVADLLRRIPMSRRLFESRFRGLFGRSPGEELARVRLEHARRLLLDTDWPMSTVAARCGLCDAEYLSRLFRRHLGFSPTAYRRLNGRGAEGVTGAAAMASA